MAATNSTTFDYSLSLPKQKQATTGNYSAENPPTTIALTITPPSTPKVCWYENTSIIVPALSFLGVLATIAYSHFKSKSEMSHATKEAELNRVSAQKIAELQRNSSRDEQHLDRITNARKEAYAEAISSIQGLLQALTKLAHVNYDESDVAKKLSTFHLSISKIELLCEVESIIAAKKLSQHIAKLHLYLSGKRIEIDRKERELLSLKDDIKSRQKFHDDLIDDFEKGRADWPEHGSTVDRQLDSNLRKIRETQSDISKINGKLDAMRLNYSKELLDHVKELSMLMIPLTISARAELGLKTDKDALISQIEIEELDIKQAFEEFVQTATRRNQEQPTEARKEL